MTVHRAFLEWLERDFSSKQGQIAGFHGADGAGIAFFSRFLQDFKYLSEKEFDSFYQFITLHKQFETKEAQDASIRRNAAFKDKLHLVSIYKGIQVSSMIFDSTGTKKLAALASYVLDALEQGRILVVDELDNSLHFKLTHEIIAMFNNEMN